MHLGDRSWLKGRVSRCSLCTRPPPPIPLVLAKPPRQTDKHRPSQGTPEPRPVPSTLTPPKYRGKGKRNWAHGALGRGCSPWTDTFRPLSSPRRRGLFLKLPLMILFKLFFFFHFRDRQIHSLFSHCTPPPSCQVFSEFKKPFMMR